MSIHCQDMRGYHLVGPCGGSFRQQRCGAAFRISALYEYSLLWIIEPRSSVYLQPMLMAKGECKCLYYGMRPRNTGTFRTTEARIYTEFNMKLLNFLSVLGPEHICWYPNELNITHWYTSNKCWLWLLKGRLNMHRNSCLDQVELERRLELLEF